MLLSVQKNDLKIAYDKLHYSGGTKNSQNMISNFACNLFVYLFSDEINIDIQHPTNNNYLIHEDCLFKESIKEIYIISANQFVRTSYTNKDLVFNFK